MPNKVVSNKTVTNKFVTDLVTDISNKQIGI